MPRPSVEAERREQILIAACDVIASVGIAELRLADVAKLAGVSSGTVHYYFDNKKDVLHSAFEYNLEESLLRRNALLKSGKSGLSRLNELVESYLPRDEQSLRGWKVWLALWTEATRDPSLSDVNDRLYGQWRDVVSSVIRAAQDEGTVRQGDPVTLANMLIGMLDGLAVQVVLGSRAVRLTTIRRTIKQFIRDDIAV